MPREVHTYRHSRPLSSLLPRARALHTVIAPAPQSLCGRGWYRVMWLDPAGSPIASAYRFVPATRALDTARFKKDQCAFSILRAATASTGAWSPPSRFNTRNPRTVFIVGSGPMGFALARSVATLARRWDVPCRVVVIGRYTFGTSADPSVAVIRNQGILHRGGTLWAHTAPETARAVRLGADLLVRFAPSACQRLVNAIGVIHEDAPISGAEYVEACRALGGNPNDFGVIPLHVARRMLPSLPQSVAAVVRIPETTVDITVLGQELRCGALAAGASIVAADATRLLRNGDRICGIQLDDGVIVPVADEDIVVLAAGPRIKSLGSTADTSFPGLRHFASALVATPSLDSSVPLALSLFGGATMVPHPRSCVLGNAERVPIDGPALESSDVKDRLVKGVRRSAQQDLGVTSPPFRSWTATKVEVTDSDRCQDHAIVPAAGVESLFAAIPGKMTTCVYAATQMATALIRPWLIDVGRSVWEEQATAVCVDSLPWNKIAG